MARRVAAMGRGIPCGLGDGAQPAAEAAAGCDGGEVQQLLVWEPAEAWVVLEDPDCRPYVWDLPDN